MPKRILEMRLGGLGMRLGSGNETRYGNETGGLGMRQEVWE